MEGSVVHFKVGVCRVCRSSHRYGPDWQYYAESLDRFTFCCDDCIDDPETRCQGCGFSEDSTQLLLCDQCETRGTTCLKCACLSSVPEGKWFCSEACEQLANKRKRTGMVLATCTIMSGGAKGNGKQYYSHCNTCDANVCMSCASVCHYGHALEPQLKHGAIVCDCGRDELCNESVFRKAARVDEMASVKSDVARVKREWEIADDEMHKLESDMEAQKQHIGEYEQILAVSLGRESELRQTLQQCALCKAPGDLCELVTDIVDEVRIRQDAAETAQRAEHEHASASVRLAQMKEKRQQLQDESTALTQRAKKMLDFETL